MAPVKARRARPVPPPPKKKPQPVPRLAEIQLNAASLFQRKAAPKRRGATLGGLVLIGGATIAGAAWIGGSLFDVRETFYVAADRIAATAGLEASLDVRGVAGARRAEIEGQSLPPGRISIMAASPDAIKARVESLDWVEEARVARLWPSTIRITVKRREAFALWQENGFVTVIDAAGERVHDANPADYKDLPRVVGAGAGPAAEPVLLALEQLPAVRERVAALVRVGHRRWNLNLRNGVVVALPETGELPALVRAEALERRYGVLDGRFGRVDLRQDGALIVAPPRPSGGDDAKGA